MKLYSLILFFTLFLSISFSHPALAKKEKPVSFEKLSSAQKILKLTQLVFTGRSEEALKTLSKNGPLKLNTQLKNRLLFIQAYLQLMGGHYKEAAEGFENLKGKYSEVASILPYWSARAERLAGNPQKALEILEKSCKGPCLSPERVAREYASASCESENPERGLELFHHLLTSHPNSSGLIQMDLIECKIKNHRYEPQGKPWTQDSVASHGELTKQGLSPGATRRGIKKQEEACHELKKLFIEAPAGIPKDRFVSLLKTLHELDPEIPSDFSSQDQLTRITSLKNQDRWVEAGQELKTVLQNLDETSQTSLRPNAAETFYKARDYWEASKQYEKLLEEQPENAEQNTTLEKLASCYARSNQFDKALALQKQLASSQPKTSANTSYKIAFILADANRCEEAVVAFQEFMDQFPKSTKREEALWAKAWCLYRLGRLKEAVQNLNLFENLYPKDPYLQRVVYWRYRFLEMMGDAEQAKISKNEFIEKWGSSFYESWENFYRKNNNSHCPQASYNPLLVKKDFPSLSILFPHHSPGDLSTLEELLSLGLWEDFLELYQQKTSTTDLTPLASQDQLALWLNFIAKAENVPPELVWAVMYEESHFKPKALSAAGAMGLMQIIPQTGYSISDSLKLSSFDSQDLLEPLVNVRFGVHYLAQLLEQFSGDLVQTIAAYNAGPEAVQRWKGQKSDRPCDEFIEEIPYRETNNYVKKVMKSFWNYQSKEGIAE